MKEEEQFLKSRLRVGKYQGKEVGEIEDYNYLRWVVEKAKGMTHGVKQGARIKMKQIEYYGR